MFCPQCGNELWTGDNFCSNCGTTVRQKGLEKEPENKIAKVVGKEPIEQTDTSAKEADQPRGDASAKIPISTPKIQAAADQISVKEPPDPMGKSRLDFPDGSSYFGHTLNGEPHSEGIMRYPDGSVYEGEFEYGKRSGVGTLTNRNRGFRRAGEWKNDKFDKREEKTQDKGVNSSENSGRSIQGKEDKKNWIASAGWVIAIIFGGVVGLLIVRYGGLIPSISVVVGSIVFTKYKNQFSKFVALIFGVVSCLATLLIVGTAYMLMTGRNWFTMPW
jgi:hypothetical protein